MLRGRNSGVVTGGSGCRPKSSKHSLRVKPGKRTSRLPPAGRDYVREHDERIQKELVPEWLAHFRKTKVCTPVEHTGVCKETLEHYRKLREDLIVRDPENANKIIVQRHWVPQCYHCHEGLPVWSMVVNEYLNGEKNSRYIFLDSNENETRTPGITQVPTIIKYSGNKICMTHTKKYEKLKEFIDSE